MELDPAKKRNEFTCQQARLQPTTEDSDYETQRRRHSRDHCNDGWRTAIPRGDLESAVSESWRRAHDCSRGQDISPGLDEVLAPFAKDPKRFEVASTERCGRLARYARGGEAASKTEWVAFCDGDDVWCKGKTSAQRAFAEKNNAVLSAADHYLTDEKGAHTSRGFGEVFAHDLLLVRAYDVMRKYPFRKDEMQGGRSPLVV